MMASPQRTAKYLNFLAFLLVFWAAFPPSYYLSMIVLLVALPWVAIRLKASNPEYGLEWRRKKQPANISRFFVIPGFVLMVRAYTDYNIIYGMVLLVVVGLIAFAMNVAVYKAENQNEDEPVPLFTFSRVVLAILLLPYCYGLAVQANVLLDIWPPKEYNVKVLGVYDWGRRWSVKVEPWGEMHDLKHVWVSHKTYQATPQGGQVCLHQHTGALFVNWYDIGECKN